MRACLSVAIESRLKTLIGGLSISLWGYVSIRRAVDGRHPL